MPTESDKLTVKFDAADLARDARTLSMDEKGIVVCNPPRGPVVTLPRYICLTNDLAWVLGFFMAEGSIAYAGIGIANCEIALIKKFKKTMEESFGIGKEKWRAYIKTSDRNLEKIRKKWKTALRLNHAVVNFARLARKDNVELRLNNTIFSIVFDKFVKKALPALPARRRSIVSFLDGYEVGDGSVIQRNGCLYGIVITVKDRAMKEFLVECFKRLYGHSPLVRRTKECYEIGVTGVHTMTRLILDGHFASSARQWKKLLRCYLKKEYVRSHVRYWLALSNECASITDIAQKTERSHWSVRDALNKDFTLGLVNMQRRHIRNKRAPYFKFYGLSEEGRKLLKIIERGEYYDKDCFDTGSSGT